MTLHISRKRRSRRVANQLTPDITNLIAGKLNQQSMSAIARELNLPVHVIKHVRDTMAKKQVKPRDARREAELYVLSKVGKCTDSFAEYETYVHNELLPQATKYKRDMSKSLAKISAGFIPPNERN